MAIFIKTVSGKPQNLLLLQTVKAIDSLEIPNKYSLAYIEKNGQIHEDMIYDTLAEAEAKAEEVRQELLT